MVVSPASANMGHQVSLMHQPASQREETLSPRRNSWNRRNTTSLEKLDCQARAPWHYITHAQMKLLLPQLDRTAADSSICRTSQLLLSTDEQTSRILGGFVLKCLFVFEFYVRSHAGSSEASRSISPLLRSHLSHSASEAEMHHSLPPHDYLWATLVLRNKEHIFRHRSG